MKRFELHVDFETSESRLSLLRVDENREFHRNRRWQLEKTLLSQLIGARGTHRSETLDETEKPRSRQFGNRGFL